MRQMIRIAAAGVLIAGFSSAALAASPWGMWKRPNGSIAKVWPCKGGMCGKVVKGKGAGRVMFDGIKRHGGVWKGKMKHPGMPRFMTFNGTVTLLGNKMKVQGCAIGNAMCDAETWVRAR
ncbi:MAG TPA: hypothetical protein ENK15_07210 [Thermopetrobacter sp.]|nr:hypothetical protein [Thermopetrobacter sp.]